MVSAAEVIEASSLPAINAGLNATAAILLCVGFVLIRQGRRRAHAGVMLAASAISAVFLTCYLVYHLAVVPELGHTPFRGTGVLRWGYYALLISHVLLAVINLPMVLVTLWRASRRDWERHRRLARRTFPIWLYVSVTGVLVYLVLYHWNPSVE